MRLGLSYIAANIFQYNYSDGAVLGLRGPNGDIYRLLAAFFRGRVEI